MAGSTKMIAIPVDGSENALKSLDYLDLMYGPEDNLEVNIFYILSSLPLALTQDPAADGETAAKLNAVTAKNIHVAKGILVEAKETLIRTVFSE